MKRRFTTLTMIMVVASAMMSLSCQSRSDEEAPKAVAEQKKTLSPKIVVAKSDFDFGKVKQGTDVEHVYKIQNKGKADLIIEKAKGS
ncbi:MAG: DUF1573 domain-containing protein [Deltaproteobacteria bacterium]|nr:DUF1573 domain-containing protein [Deltaproteobacteria bacterium]